ncbi:MAG: PilZ domain [Frankiaceae bacterium]|jgi:hypothetical protein|nr:PilZ domain [Frankiaceae bacterium]MDQ1649499.1 PilZ domain [Frankiaceae bacterium]MDQ1673483.1 PilZ domain [Frankiaceae bacterium]
MTSDFSVGGRQAPADRTVGPGPATGSTVSLLPTQGVAPALSARLESWLASPGGLAVTAEVRLDRSGTELLAGSTVWATFRTGDGGQLVLSALARPSSGEPEVLELTGVAMLAREHRRDAVRAGLRQDVRLVTGEVEHSATTLDLSSGGCRVQVADPSAFEVGGVVDVQLELDGEAPLTAAGQVVRSDQVAHEVAVRFLDLTDDDEAVLDALVYSAIGTSG